MTDLITPLFTLLGLVTGGGLVLAAQWINHRPAPAPAKETPAP